MNQAQQKWISWNGNKVHNYQNLYTPTTEQELQEIVKNSKNVRVFGGRFSSSDINAGTNTLIDITQYNKIVNINKEAKQITVQAGITLKELIEAVQNEGWCIPCLPDINSITVAGALATATHGTNGFILSKYVSKFRMIGANDTIKEFTDADFETDAIRVSLGLLGVFSEITFQCEANYKLHLVEQPMTDKKWTSNLDEYLKTYDFVRILWIPHTNHGYVILGKKVGDNFKFTPQTAPKYHKHRRATSKILYKYTHIFPKFTALANKILYRLFFTATKEHAGSLYDATVTKSRGQTMELAEWTIPYTKFQTLFQDLKTMLESSNNRAYVHVPMDVRFIKKDNAWLSYAADEDMVTIGCVCRTSDKAALYEAFDAVENVFLKHGGKPHWAKHFKAEYAQLSKLYTKWNDFEVLRAKMDPTNKFLNGYLSKLFIK